MTPCTTHFTNTSALLSQSLQNPPCIDADIPKEILIQGASRLINYKIGGANGIVVIKDIFWIVQSLPDLAHNLENTLEEPIYVCEDKLTES